MSTGYLTVTLIAVAKPSCVDPRRCVAGKDLAAVLVVLHSQRHDLLVDNHLLGRGGRGQPIPRPNQTAPRQAL